MGNLWLVVTSLALGLRGHCVPSSVTQASRLPPSGGPSPAPQPLGAWIPPPARPSETGLTPPAPHPGRCSGRHRHERGGRVHGWPVYAGARPADGLRLGARLLGVLSLAWDGVFLLSLVFRALTIEVGGGVPLWPECGAGGNFLCPQRVWGGVCPFLGACLPASGDCEAVSSSRSWGQVHCHPGTSPVGPESRVGLWAVGRPSYLDVEASGPSSPPPGLCTTPQPPRLTRSFLSLAQCSRKAAASPEALSAAARVC